MIETITQWATTSGFQVGPAICLGVGIVIAVLSQVLPRRPFSVDD